MNTKKQPNTPETGREISDRQNTSLLRTGVLFLALVSFFTTANGMKTYIFTEHGTVAYAASAAIQSILLALSMNLPKYIQEIWNSGRKSAELHSAAEHAENAEMNHGPVKWRQPGENSKLIDWLSHYLIRGLLCGITIILTFVTILCSSWFSYVYIADVIHKGSWDTDSELLVQQAYRAELYGARDYAHTYRTYLEESVGEDILLLEQQTQMIDDSTSTVEVDWDEEAAAYMSDNGTAASYMSPVILAMRDAMEGNASQEDLDLAATAIANAKENISSRIEAVQTNLERINANLANYSSQVTALTARVNNATDATDIANLNASINNLTQMINTATQQQISLQQESAQLDNAFLHLPYYESLLGLSNSTSSISIRRQLIQLQSEFFKPDPDDQILLNVAADIFSSLRKAANTGASGANNESPNELSYTNLLIQTNRLIGNLTDYSGIKAIEANLDELIADLRTTSENDQSKAETDHTGSEQDNIAPDQDDTGSEQDNMAPDQDDTGSPPDDVLSEQGGLTANEPSPGQSESDDSAEEPENKEDSSNPANANDLTWQEKWRIRLESLKAQISAMPIYSETGETETNDVKVLTDSQLEVLRSYDRNASSATLDNMIRRYISNHNAVYKGLIYLTSPYRMLAIFALCLALSFDLSGFVFGVVMQGEPQRNKNEVIKRNAIPHHIEAISGHTKSGNSQAEWSILEHCHQYRVLTGDFSRKDDIYYYKVFRDGLAEQWAVKATDNALYKQGIYNLDESPAENVADDTNQTSGMKRQLLYAGQKGGPQDGVFVNCCLVYKDGGLGWQKSSERWSFICSLEEYVPVHCYSPFEKEHRTFPVKLLTEQKEWRAKTAVIALNKSGTRVSAIYMIRDN